MKYIFYVCYFNGVVQSLRWLFFFNIGNKRIEGTLLQKFMRWYCDIAVLGGVSMLLSMCCFSSIILVLLVIGKKIVITRAIIPIFLNLFNIIMYYFLLQG